LGSRHFFRNGYGNLYGDFRTRFHNHSRTQAGDKNGGTAEPAENARAAGS
jgi:hypothetical protein